MSDPRPDDGDRQDDVDRPEESGVAGAPETEPGGLGKTGATD
jgi:hypothetical protein